VCAPILYQGTAANKIPAGIGAHQQNATNENRHYDLGRFSTELSFADGILQLTYINGDYCRTAATNRTAILTFSCVSGSGAGQPVFLYEDNDCNYVFEWETAYACPNSGSLSTGSIFGIV